MVDVSCDDDDITLTDGRARPAAQPATEAYRVVVMLRGALTATHLFPRETVVAIGRGRGNAIMIRERAISRWHARLYLGSQLAIQDLGSSMGTTVHGCRLEPHETCALDWGDPVTLGPATVVVHRAVDDGAARVPSGMSVPPIADSTLCMRLLAGSIDTALAALRAAVRDRDAIIVTGPDTARIEFHGNAGADRTRLVERLDARLALAGVRALWGSDATAPQADSLDRGELVVADPAMRDIHELLRRLATTRVCAVLRGEVGVGKRHLARELCAGQADQAGQDRGAHGVAEIDRASLVGWPANGRRDPAWSAIDHGLAFARHTTVVISEIAALSLDAQAALVEMLDRDRGAVPPRLVATSSIDLEAAVRAAQFREDLYLRLASVVVRIPPLRERRSEIEPLARRFAQRASEREGHGSGTLTPAAIELLLEHDWPGNLVELRDVVERAAIACGDGFIERHHVRIERAPVARGATRDVEPMTMLDTYPPRTGTEQRQMIVRALEQSGGNQATAASLLGISRRTLINRLDRFSLPRPRKRT